MMTEKNKIRARKIVDNIKRIELVVIVRMKCKREDYIIHTVANNHKEKFELYIVTAVRIDLIRFLSLIQGRQRT
jgi:hypothetical protein